MIKKLKRTELDIILSIIDQNGLKSCDGGSPDVDWIENFMVDGKCYALGYYHYNKLVSIILAENLAMNGCIVWYIATDKEHQNNNFGTNLLKFFEKYVKEKFDVQWVYLNSTKNSLNFYRKNEYITSEHSIVYEHVKNI